MEHKKGLLIIGLIGGLILEFIGISSGFKNIRRLGGFCLFFGGFLSNSCIQMLHRLSYEKEFPDLVHKEEIERQDERNRTIRFMAKSKSADIVQWCILLVAALIYFSDSPLWPAMVLIGVFTLRYGIEQYYVAKFRKEM